MKYRPLLLDAAAAAVISALICAASDELVFMSFAVPLVVACRMFAWRLWRLGPLRNELAFFALCTLIGGFNDWNTVCLHGVYDYTVPAFFPDTTTVPCWMLLYWGVILRSLVSLTSGLVRRDRVRCFGDRPALKVVLQLALVLATRLMIFRHFEDPWLSWLPFVIATVVYLALFGITRAQGLLFVGMILVGVAIEALYIQVGGLHAYPLGVLGGVPIWIAVWWGLALLIWGDIGGRLQAACSSVTMRAEHPVTRRGSVRGHH